MATRASAHIRQQVEEILHEIALQELLERVRDEGVVEVHLRQLFRLTGRGNRSAGFYADVISTWKSIGGVQSDLYLRELPGERLMLSNGKFDQVRQLIGD